MKVGFGFITFAPMLSAPELTDNIVFLARRDVLSVLGRSSARRRPTIDHRRR